jgi:hypothetical protein
VLATEIHRDGGRIYEYSLIELLYLTARVKRNNMDFFRSQLDPIDRMAVDFMAEIWPDEGLDVLGGQFPKNATRLTSTFLALFSSQTASTVITSSQVANNITEAIFTNYARQTLATATWGAMAAGTGGRKTTYPQVTFPTVGATGDTINGFWITDISGTSGDIAIAVANFDDTTAVALATNDVIKVTPTLQFNN